MNALHRFRSQFHFFFSAKRRGHGVHSPFVYDLARKVFPPNPSDHFKEHPAENWRRECLSDDTRIEVCDFGTGVSGPRKISDIAAAAAKPPAQAQLLFRIVRYFKPQKMLELGTSLGITSLYEAKAAGFEKFISLEGCPQTAAKAREAFQKNKLSIDVRTGEFDTTLKPALEDLQQVDYVYFDGNHREAATLRYFETCLPYAHAGSVFIFDDIHWSEEMGNAWEKIRQHPKVRVSIDVFHFGIVLFREEQREQEHFVMKV